MNQKLAVKLERTIERLKWEIRNKVMLQEEVSKDKLLRTYSNLIATEKISSYKNRSNPVKLSN